MPKLEKIETDSNVSNYTPASGNITTFLAASGSSIVMKAKKSDGSIVTLGGSGGAFDLVKVTSYTASPLAISGVRAIAYNASTNVWTFDSSTLNFSSAEKTPVLTGIYAASGNALIGNAIDMVCGIDSDSLVFYAPLQSECTTDYTGKSLTASGNINYTTHQNRACAGFAGSSKITFPSSGINSGKNARSVSLMMYAAEETSSWCLAFGSGGYDDRTQFGIAKDSDNHIAFGGGGLDAQSEISAMAWHHVCVAFSDNELKLYIDAVLQNTMDATDLNVGDTGTIAIGCSNTTDLYFNGYISDVAIWNKKLSAAQVQAEYNRLTQN